jgi:hypothetical protein
MIRTTLVVAESAVVGSRKEKGMSLHSPLVYVIPDETVRVARAAFPKGTLVIAPPVRA